jgi:NAD(P)-dependent dehydrogenase (short-subunit alcohol dehydrogenase family)
MNAAAANPPANRVVLVTGAARGMGHATARRFLAAGDRVAVADIDAAALHAAWPDAAADRVLPVVLDVADPAGAAAGVAKVLGHFGRIDVLVNNAALHGAGWTGPCLELAPEQWTRLLAVNILGIVNVTRAAARALSDSSGVVVNMSSMTAYGHGPSSGYAVTKAAVNGLTTSLAEELGRRGVRVVGVAPGFIATDTVLAALPPDRPDAIAALQTLPVRGTAEDIAALIAFLASPAARLITGQTVVADAGITRRP